MKRSEFLKTLGLGLMAAPVLPALGAKLYEAGSGDKILMYNSESFQNLRINDTVVLPGGRSYLVTCVWREYGWAKLGSKNPKFPNVRLESWDKFFLIPNLK